MQKPSQRIDAIHNDLIRERLGVIFDKKEADKLYQEAIVIYLDEQHELNKEANSDKVL